MSGGGKTKIVIHTDLSVYFFPLAGIEAMHQLHSDSSMDPMSVTMTQTSAFMQDLNGSPVNQPPPAISVVTFRWDAKIKDNKGGPDR